MDTHGQGPFPLLFCSDKQYIVGKGYMIIGSFPIDLAVVLYVCFLLVKHD